MKHHLAILGLGLLLAGCGSELSNKNPLLAPAPTPTPACPPAPVLFENFSGASLANPGTYGDTGSSVVNSVVAGVWNMVVTSAGWGAGSNVESNFGLASLTCHTSLKFDIRSSQAGSYTVRFRENGPAVSMQDENWVSGSLTLPVGASFTTVTVALSSFTEDQYGNTACGGNCQGAGNGNNIRETDAILKFEIAYTTALSAANVDIDNIRYE